MDNRKKIYDILMSFKTQESDEGEREKYYPINIYCENCKKDTTEVVSYDDETKELIYKCKACGNTHTVTVGEYNLIKLAWKIDWPMRWVEEQVDFEPGGIDHAAASGSYVVAKEIAAQVFNFKAPLFQAYGWLSIAGLGDMHSSTGRNITPSAVLEVYEPDMIRWLFAKYDPTQAFSFNFDDTIIRHYSEFDKGLDLVKAGGGDEYLQSIYKLCMIDGVEAESKVPFGVLASVATIVDFNPVAVKKILTKIGVNFTERDESRLLRVKNWIENHQPSKLYKLLENKNTEFFANCDEEEKSVVKKLYDYLVATEEIVESEVQQYIYSVINMPELTKKQNMQRQQKFFKVFYNVLFGSDMGPRLYLFLSAIDKENYIELLNLN